ncbi:hypothetical protein [Microviridae sp.]|nr:hypothetical protein [Microviridae sp.]
MKRFKLIPNSLALNSVIDVEEPGENYDGVKTLADDSYFVPESAIVRQASKLNATIPPNFYMFPDGKDDGRALPSSLKKGVDIAELSQLALQADKQIRKDLEKIAKEEDFKKDREIFNESLKNAVTVSPEVSTPVKE